MEGAQSSRWVISSADLQSAIEEGPDDPRWSALKSARVVHLILGAGIIVGVKIRLRYIPEFEISIGDEIDRYNSEALLHFGEIELFPSNSNHSWIWPVLTKRVHDRRVIKEAAAARQRAEEERIQQYQEYLSLCEVYVVSPTRRDEIDIELYALMKRIHDALDLEWVSAESVKSWEEPVLLASYHERMFEITGNLRSVVEACSSWRKAKQPSRALALTDTLIDSPRVQHDAAFWTTRGGAQKDLGHYTAAEQSGLTALRIQDSAHSPKKTAHPHNLLGSVYYHLEAWDDSALHFETAARLEEPLRANSREFHELKRVFRNSDPDQRRRALMFFLSRDEKRYAFLKGYM